METLKQGCETRKVPPKAMFQAMRTLEKAKLPVRVPYQAPRQDLSAVPARQSRTQWLLDFCRRLDHLHCAA